MREKTVVLNIRISCPGHDWETAPQALANALKPALENLLKNVPEMVKEHFVLEEITTEIF